ncbi:MAG: hypothetical protein PHE43_04245 [Candidatus Nanoarchaeia archaeon]|nr:hypothetical protein [Candidatus Nanoarchaeia archaeon]
MEDMMKEKHPKDSFAAKLEDSKKDIEKFKKEVLKKFDKYILGMSILPPKLPEELRNEEYLKLEAEKKEHELINILILIDDSDSKKMSKEELGDKLTNITKEMATSVNKKLNPIPLLLSGLKESCFDSKFDILKAIGMSIIFYDKGILGALKTAEIHKAMTVEKFERYVLSYVAAGSLFRGDANSNDIDIFIVIDDTDVKRMPRAELKTKLRAIIQNMGFSASKISGIDASFHVQTYILTDFWESVRDANPVIFTLLRDGVPLYDRGVFLPWRLLLNMGKIKPSLEAIEMNMEIGERLVERTKAKMMSILGEDLFYATLNPGQAALMLYGIPPTTPKETVRLMDEIFVKKEKLLEKKYVDILEKIRKYYKDLEHGRIKEVSGKEIDELLKDTEDYLKRIQKLFAQIEKKSNKEKLNNNYDTCIHITQDVLELEGVKPNINKLEVDFKRVFVDKGIFPEKFIRILKDVIRVKKDFDSKKENSDVMKQEIAKTLRESNEYIKTLVEHIERKKSYELDKITIRFKHGDLIGEVLLFDKVAFIIDNIEKRDEINKADIIGGKLRNINKSSLEEFEEYIKTAKIPASVFIQESIFSDLKTLFGKDVEIMVNY